MRRVTIQAIATEKHRKQTTSAAVVSSRLRTQTSVPSEGGGTGLAVFRGTSHATGVNRGDTEWAAVHHRAIYIVQIISVGDART